MVLKRLISNTYDKGFLTGYAGKYDNVLKIRPPLVFSHENADEFLAAFDECMQEVSEQPG